MNFLATKLHVPRLGSDIVHRERLLEVLDRCYRVPLTLVSAPPGYGKSVLAADWVRSRSRSVAWLALDEQESDLRRFLMYLLAALKHSTGAGLDRTASMLTVAERVSTRRLAQTLANDLDDLNSESVIVLDDFHLLDHDSEVQSLMTLLLDHPPSGLHIILLTRRDPPLRLARLRANHELVELRQDSLRFQAEETEELIRTAMGRDLSAAALARIHEGLEGWGAAIRMASIAALRTGGDALFEHELTGGLQHIQEYLFEEVIKGMNPQMLRYLLISALPSRFCAELLDEIAAGLPDLALAREGQEFIRQVERNNLFATAQGAEGRWFRYHHLFRELLQQLWTRELEYPVLADITSHACRWLESGGFVDEALRLWLQQARFAEAAAVVERHRKTALDVDQWVVLEGWLSMFPPAERSRWPELLLARASLATFEFDIDLLADFVHRLEEHETAESLGPVSRRELRFFSAVPLFWTGETAKARQSLEQATDGPLSCDQLTGELEVYLAMSRSMTGDHGLALQRLDRTEAANGGRRNVLASRLMAARSYVHYFALQPAASLHQAERLAQLGASDLPSRHVMGWGHYMRTLCLLNSGRLEAARQAAMEATKHAGHLEKRVRVDLYLALGICACHLGTAKESTAAVQVLEGLRDASESGPELQQLARSALTRLALLRGDLEAATVMAEDLPQSFGAGTQVVWLDEPALSWARTQLARDDRAAARLALPVLVEYRGQSEAQHLRCHQVELLLLEAIACATLGQVDDAISRLASALDLALPAGWTGPLLEIPRWPAGLAPESLPQLEQRAFFRNVLRARRNGRLASRSNALPEGSEYARELARFTNRELDILVLLAERRQNKEIASRLFISTNTVSYHLKRVYRKLEVSGRREAVIRARELGLLGSN